MQKNASLAQVTAIGDATAAVRRTAPGVKSDRGSQQDRILSVVAVCESGAATGGFAPERRVCLRAAAPSQGGTVSVEIRALGMRLDAASREALQAAFFEALSLAWESEPPVGETRRKAGSARPGVPGVTGEAMPAPKRRGRPPKVRVEGETQPNPATGKRPVGRPRIHPKPDPDAPKRPVGRPRKNPLG